MIFWNIIDLFLLFNEKVYITINGNSVEDLYMELGEAGEAIFIEEETVK